MLYYNRAKFFNILDEPVHVWNDSVTLAELVLLYHQSYLAEIRVDIPGLESFVDIVSRLRKKRGTDGTIVASGELECTEEYLHSEYLSDAVEKLGFIYFSRDKVGKEIKNLNGCKYYIYNSVFDCKAFLDTMAGLINHHYKLVKTKSLIDLNKPEFMRELQKPNKDPTLEREIRNFMPWIQAVSNLRNELIHRRRLLLLWDKKGKCFMSIGANGQPKGLFEIGILKAPIVDPIDFCEENTKCAKSIIDVVLKNLERDMRSRPLD